VNLLDLEEVGEASLVLWYLLSAVIEFVFEELLSFRML